MRLLVGMVGVLAACSQSAATTRSYPNSWDTGVVCLDEATGKPLWEYFPTQRGSIKDVTTDGERLLLGRFWPCHRERYRNTRSLEVELVEAVDLETGEPLSDRSLPPCKELIFPDRGHWNPSRRITASGDRVVGRGHEDRTLTIMRGDSSEVRKIIPVGTFMDFVVVDDSVVVISVGDSRRGISGAVWAIDLRSERQLWKLEDDFRSIGLGEKAVYVSQEGRVRALDPQSGQTLWDRGFDRVRGGSSILEHDGRVFVTSNYLDDGPPYYLYCLDAGSGDLLWTYETHGSLLRFQLLFADGRVYVQTLPSNLMHSWRFPSGQRRPGYGQTVTGVAPWPIEERFAHKSDAEIELNLRAWHAYGDHSAVAILRAAAVALDGGALSSLARKLADTFPPARDPLALLAFLDERFEQNPELGPEIRRVLEAFNPVPYWYGRETTDFNRKPIPQFDLDLRERAVIDWFTDLKVRVDEVPVTRLTMEALGELLSKKTHASLDSLVAAHDDSDDRDYRMLARFAIYAQHPQTGSDWALGHLNEIDPMEITQWVQRTTIGWLLAHEDLYRQWLFHEDASVRRFSAGRMSRAEDPALVAPLCVTLLEEAMARPAERSATALRSALWALGKTGDTSHVPLIRAYFDGEVDLAIASGEAADAQAEKDKNILQAAGKVALTDLGIFPKKEKRSIFGSNRAFPQQQARPRKPLPPSAQLWADIRTALREGDSEAARALAQAILAETSVAGVDLTRWFYPLLCAYEAMEEWDKAIEHMRAKPLTLDQDHLLRLLSAAKRFDEVIEIAKKTPFSGRAMKAAFMLIDGDRLEAASEIFSNELARNPSEWQACVGLALIQFRRGALAKADTLIERAMALRPRPEKETAFRHLTEYWIKRKQPERARSWVRESLDRDFKWWDFDGMLDWAATLPELADTVENARNRRASD